MKYLGLNECDVKDAIKKIESIDLQNTSIDELEELLNPLFIGYKVSAPRFETGIYLYRGRICDKPSNTKDVNYPLPSVITSYGRLNNISESIFYGTTARGVPFFELGVDVGDRIALSVWKSTERMLLNHVGFTDECTTLLNSKRNLDRIYEFVKETNNFGDLNNFVHSYLASKFSETIKKGEEYKYKLTIAIGRKLIMGDLFAGILYPTIVMSGNADNIAIKTEYVDSAMSFVSVEYIEVTERNGMQYKINTLDSATKLDSNGDILWSGRNLCWLLKNKDEEIVMKSKGGAWVAYDRSGNRIYPE